MSLLVLEEWHGLRPGALDTRGWGAWVNAECEGKAWSCPGGVGAGGAQLPHIPIPILLQGHLCHCSSEPSSGDMLQPAVMWCWEQTGLCERDQAWVPSAHFSAGLVLGGEVKHKLVVRLQRERCACGWVTTPAPSELTSPRG